MSNKSCSGDINDQANLGQVPPGDERKFAAGLIRGLVVPVNVTAPGKRKNFSVADETIGHFTYSKAILTDRKEAMGCKQP
ncbi:MULTISPECIES: hypothetical protein [Microbulbifer]|uniref:hypothetical protein n=1 Tax=Microbulbifer TaxID=48073 RepID=UPI001F3F985B|nr:hypothetical protein [Microbulbifer zhoushanensis]